MSSSSSVNNKLLFVIAAFGVTAAVTYYVVSTQPPPPPYLPKPETKFAKVVNHHTRHHLQRRSPSSISMNRIGNNSYNLFNDNARGDGFAGAAGEIVQSPYSTPSSFNSPFSSQQQSQFVGGQAPQPVNTTDPLQTAAIGDTSTVPTIIVDPPVPDDVRVINIENQILKMIIANTTSVRTILSNIDTIKDSIDTYRYKIHLTFQQLQLGNITPVQMNQFLTQVILEIATNLQLPLNPSFIMSLGAAPYVPVTPLL